MLNTKRAPRSPAPRCSSPRQIRRHPRRTRGGSRRAARRRRSTGSSGSTSRAGDQLGIDMSDLVTIVALQRAGIRVADGAVTMLEARKLKTADEIALLDHAAGIVDAVYEEIYRMLRPGAYEHRIVARAQQLL